ncbi:MAG: transglutaminase-like domain-containing protein [Candidatus Aminicenantaceae bacterium]
MKYIRQYRWPIFSVVLYLLLSPPIMRTEITGIGDPAKPGYDIFYREASSQETGDVSETWMGVYMQGVKVGYSHSKEFNLVKDGKTFQKSIQESLMRVSRLGGNPVEISTMQDSLYDAERNPVETTIRTKLSQNETVIKAEVKPDRIVFYVGDKITKELPYAEKFDFGVPLAKIIETDGLSAGMDYTFKILEPLTQSLIAISFEVLEEESVLILGEHISLWHVRTKMTEIFPIVMDEWVDGKGKVWKSVSDAGFLHTTSIRMPKEKALEMSDQNLDIAFSVLIESNVEFTYPQEVQKVTYKVSGIPVEKIKSLPFDGASQTLLDVKEDHAIIQTRSLVFTEENAIPFPVKDEEFAEYLASTVFCQSDDIEVEKTAKGIVEDEQNSWVASKKIAEWVSREMEPNYNVGFASAKEILENREGDCSEFTVLMVALCRSVGIPARAAVGVMYGQGIFAYHMWPEVYVGEWVGLDAKWLAVDKQSGEYYTDATHIKLGDSALDEGIFQEMGQAMSEVIGKLKLEVLEYIQDQ